MKKILFFFLLCTTAVLFASDFRWLATSDANNITFTLEISKNTTVYPEGVIFSVKDAAGKPAVAVKKPPANEVYGTGKWVWQFKGNAPFSGSIEFQRCGRDADGAEMCFAPETINISTLEENESMTADSRDTTAGENIPDLQVLKSFSGYMSKEKFLQALDSAGGNLNASSGNTEKLGIAAMFLLALLGGLGLNLTPCILPMIPINLAIIGASGSSKKSGFIRGLCYGCGMAFAYGILGIAVVLFGTPFGSLNSSWLFNFIIAAIFFILAAAMGGVINLDFSRYRKFDVSKMGKTRELTAFLMGGVSALLAGACVAPVAVTILLFSASSYNAGNPFAVLLPFALGVGMALPWPFAGAGLSVLPRPNGKVMNLVKITFVTLILITGIYYIYTGWKLLPGKNKTADEFAKLETALAESRKTGKKVLIDFWAPWCKNCIAMEKDVLNTPEVKKTLQDYIFVKFNAVDIRNPQVAALLEKCRIPGLPGYTVAVPPDVR